MRISKKYPRVLVPLTATAPQQLAGPLTRARPSELLKVEALVRPPEFRQTVERSRLHLRVKARKGRLNGLNIEAPRNFRGASSFHPCDLTTVAAEGAAFHIRGIAIPSIT
jgi:hypothetical protein